ncbi:MAG: ABC transporter ATP-binding protein [Colwellia sp.]|nr:ABC transporter ATP-binding protein [Colwellia sp.]
MSELVIIKNVSVKLQQNTILSAVNLTLTTGDILGLVGPSGCGKTTLLNTLAGFITQHQGSIYLTNSANKTLKISPDNIIAPEHRNVGMIFQDYALFPHLTVEKNICFGIEKQSKTEQKSQLIELLKLLKLEGLAQRYPHQLSGGQQQRVAIARALAPKPSLLLLDEPFSNIDARLRNELMLEMRQLLKKLKISAIFVTHNKDEVFTFADKIAVMAQGNILQTGTPSSVCQQPNSWQVADFLQLGSFIPIHKVADCNSFDSAIGEIYDKESINVNQYQQLLVKPQHIELRPNSLANAIIESITITEQGYHYLLTSLTSNDALAFTGLSFYSELFLTLGQHVNISIKPHTLIVFDDVET